MLRCFIWVDILSAPDSSGTLDSSGIILKGLTDFHRIRCLCKLITEVNN